MRVLVDSLAMLVSAAMSLPLVIVPLLLSLLIVILFIGMFALDHPGMVLIAHSVRPVVTSMIVVLTPSYCRVIYQARAHTVG